MKIGAIIQARTSSTRLPRKVLKELPFGSGITVLEQVIRRLKRSDMLDAVIIATTKEKGNDAIAAIADRCKVGCFRGERDNVLSRYYHAARSNGLDIIVRVTSDCPCVDPTLMDRFIGEHMARKADYTTSSTKKAFANGVHSEVVNFETLKRSYENASEPCDKEHVTSYIYRHPASFRIHRIKARGILAGADIRVTLDTEEDYALLCAVFDYLYEKDRYFGARDIGMLFKRKPWLKLINIKVVQKRVKTGLAEELSEAVAVLDKQGLDTAKKIIRRYGKRI